MWGSCRRNNNNNMHIKTLSQGSTNTATTNTMEDSYCYYYVQSPTEGSVSHHHSRDASACRVVVAQPWDSEQVVAVGWEKIPLDEEAEGESPRDYDGSHDVYDDDEEWHGHEGPDEGGGFGLVYRVAVAILVLLLMVMVILWGVGRSYKPRVLVQDMEFLDLNIQQGLDHTGVPTALMSLNSTVRISCSKPYTFFGIHVSSTPFILHHYGLKLASGQMEKVYQSKKSEETRTTVVMQGDQVPLYGAILVLKDATRNNTIDSTKVTIELNLAFAMSWRAYILGKLIKFQFLTNTECPVTLHGGRLHKRIDLTQSCIYK